MSGTMTDHELIRRSRAHLNRATQDWCDADTWLGDLADRLEALTTPKPEAVKGELPRDDTGRVTSDYEPTAQEIEVCRNAICREFGNNGTDGYYIRILKAINAVRPTPAQEVASGDQIEVVAWQRRLKRKEQSEKEWNAWKECSKAQADFAKQHGHLEDYPMVDAQIRPLSTLYASTKAIADRDSEIERLQSDWKSAWDARVELERALKEASQLLADLDLGRSITPAGRAALEKNP